MTRIKHILFGFLIALLATTGVTEVLAQTGIGISPTSALLKRAGNVVTFLNSSWQLGDSSNRIAAVYTSLLDATAVAIGGVVSGNLTVGGNVQVNGSSGVTAPKFTATSTAEGLSVTGGSQLTGNVTTTAGIVPATSAGASIGSPTLPYNNVYATGTLQVGDALTVIDGNGPGMAHMCVGRGQSPSSATACDGLITAYASTTGYVDTLKLYAGANGADSACIAMGNAGGTTLGRHCSLSGTPSYYMMGLNGLAFQGTSLVPAVGIDMVIRGNKVGINNAGAAPNTTLEVIGQTSSTNVYVGAGTVSAPGLAFGEDQDTGMYRLAANNPAITAGGAHSLNFNDGWVSVGGINFATMADGDGYYFGDNVRGLRYLSGGDFEFQNWHLNRFYFTKYTGSVRTRFANFDSIVKRVGLSDSADLVNTSPTTTLEVSGTGVSSTKLYVGSGVNQYSLTNVDAAIVNTGTTSTLQLGNTSKPGCMKWTDVGGTVRYVTIDAAGTAFQISASACNP